MLSPNGSFVFTFNNHASWRFWLRSLKHWKMGTHPYPYHEIDLKALRTLLDKCNLQIDDVSGMYWMPLSRTSNSCLVSVFETIEKIFRLEKWYAQSPMILISVKQKVRV